MAKYTNPSPSFPFLAGLFGQNVRLRNGSYQIVSPNQTGRNVISAPANPLFGPDTMSNIGGYLNFSGSNPYTQALGGIGQTGNFQQLPDELRDPYYTATGNLDQFIGESQPVVSSMIQTGNPTDIDSLVAAAQSRYTNEFIPQALEQYNPATGSGFGNIAAREANLMGVELGQLDFAAQEAAKQRQQWGIETGAPALTSLSTARLAMPGAVLQELQGLSESTDPGARSLAALLSLLGSTEQESAPKPRSTTGTGTDWMDTVGSILGGGGGILGSI